MATAEARPVLYVIACGAGPARQLPAFARFAQGEGWEVCVVATPAGATFLDADRMAELTGHPVRVRYKHPDEPDVLPPADAFAIAPATFNTVNKLAAGISDTLALGLVNEAIGLGQPIVAVPWPNTALARHPVFRTSVARIRDWGVRVILDPERLPGGGDPDAAAFPWPELQAALASLRAATSRPPAR
jgi:phosphopantothenoylcysteine synthetase/decarboxylase